MAEIARASSARGEVVLRRRDADGAYELRVNGVFVMDDHETSSERILATATLDALAEGRPSGSAGLTVLIGGLGLGFTLREVLSARSVRRVIVAEIEEAVVAWHRDGLIPLQDGDSVGPLSDPRVDAIVDDVRAVVYDQRDHSVDIVLLDVDNGPDFLVYEENASVYATEFLEVCLSKLTPAGVLAIWSAESSPALSARIEAVFGSVDEWRIPVILGSRATTYHLLVGRAT